VTGPVFNTGERQDLSLAGSIPVRLRYAYSPHGGATMSTCELFGEGGGDHGGPRVWVLVSCRRSVAMT